MSDRALETLPTTSSVRSLDVRDARKSLPPISEESDETRRAETASDATPAARCAAQDESDTFTDANVATDSAPAHGNTKENRWKLAFRQLVFMKRMNMQFNDRAKNEIELRQQNISVRPLHVSLPS